MSVPPEADQKKRLHPEWDNEQDGDVDGRPKSRIRRSMTACNTCRKLKTRCDVDPLSRSCRRCLSLRIECELPDVPDRQWDDSALRGVEIIPAIEQRLGRLEGNIAELTSLLKSVIQAPSRANNTPQSTLPSPSVDVDSGQNEEDEGSASQAQHVPRPVLLIRNLQSQFFGRKKDFSSESLMLGDIVTKGLVTPNLAKRLLQIFVEHYGSSISVYRTTDFAPHLRQTEPLLFSAACLLASRFMPSISKDVIHAMYAQVRRLTASVLLNAPPLRYETLQALMLLSMWSATVQTEVPIDSWLLSGVAIHHAILSFELNDPERTRNELNEETFKKLRLWNGLCVTHLHFAIGNARPCNLHERFFDHCARILDFSGAQLSDGRLVAEIGLYHNVLSLLGNKHRLLRGDTEYDELIRWKADWDHLLKDGFHPSTSTTPSAVVLWLNLYFAHLLLHRASLKLLPSPSRTLLSAAIENASWILSRSLRIQPPQIALDFPDHVFFIIAYAALTLCEFTITDPLIPETQRFLETLAANDEHIAFRFACIIGEIRRRAAGPTWPQSRTPTSLDLSTPYHSSSHLSSTGSAGPREIDGIPLGYSNFAGTSGLRTDTLQSSAVATEPAREPRTTSQEDSMLYSNLMDVLPEGFGSLEELLAGFFPTPTGMEFGNNSMGQHPHTQQG